MTLTADHVFERKTAAERATKLDGTRLLARLGLRILAVALLITCVGLWVLPGSSWESEVLLFKLILSISAGVSGLGLWQLGAPPLPPTVEVDLDIGEVRLIRESSAGRNTLIERCRFDDLGSAEQQGWQVTFWTKDARLLAEISMGNANAHATLMAALRRAGKLA